MDLLVRLSECFITDSSFDLILLTKEHTQVNVFEAVGV